MLPPVRLVETDQGRFLLMATDDAISRSLAGGQGWEKPIVELAVAIVQKLGRKNIVDIGANLGAFAIPIATALKDSTVYAFEAQRIVYYQLCGNIFANSLESVYAFNCALTSKDHAHAHFRMSKPDYAQETNVGGFSIDPLTIEHRGVFGRGKSEAPETELIEARLLDSYGLTDVGFLKIDVEGHELEVLRGAYDTLVANAYPTFCFEVWREEDCPWYAGKRREVISWILKLGYDIYTIGDFCLAQHATSPFRLILEGCTHIK